MRSPECCTRHGNPRAVFDVDTMNVVWHGHYVKYLEVARCALLDKIGHNYTRCSSRATPGR
jgi:acyl-CoA thioesterase FadM